MLEASSKRGLIGGIGPSAVAVATPDEGAATPYMLAPERPAPWGERMILNHGGLLFSIMLHLLLAAWSAVSLIELPAPPPRPQQPEQIRVVLAPPAPQAPPELPIPLTPQAEAPLVPDRASTSPESPVENPERQPTAPPTEQAPAPVPTPLPKPAAAEARQPQAPPAELPVMAAEPSLPLPPLPTPRPEADAAVQLTAEQRQRLEDLTRAAREHRQNLRQSEQQITMDVQDVQLRSAARQASFASSGSATGVVRELELQGVHPELLRRVLLRNGIEIVHRYVGPDTQNVSPFNAATTDQGTYTARDVVEPGIYEVIQSSERAMRRLAELELEYMRRHRLNPARIKLEHVKYGVVRVGESGHWDLGIVNIQYQEISEP